jgi:hypothetical protein
MKRVIGAGEAAVFAFDCAGEAIPERERVLLRAGTRKRMKNEKHAMKNEQ